MTYPKSDPTIYDLKRQAKRLRAALAEEGDFISHCEALELVAKQHGYRDWNRAAAIAGKNTIRPNSLSIGTRIAGRYLGQPFTGTILALHQLSPIAKRLSVDLDEPVDVVTFDSFSSWRKRVVATLVGQNCSSAKTSDGVPHFVVERLL
ncbi:MAG: glyoxalase superfamily protein [Parvularcula sp.]